jgi:hypothetical protein
MKYQPCPFVCGDNITSTTQLDPNLVRFYNRHLISLPSNQTYVANIDLRQQTGKFPIYVETGSVLYFQQNYLQNIYNGRIAFEYNASYSDYRMNCTPICFTNYKLDGGFDFPPWRFLVRAIVTALSSRNYNQL